MLISTESTIHNQVNTFNDARRFKKTNLVSNLFHNSLGPIRVNTVGASDVEPLLAGRAFDVSHMHAMCLRLPSRKIVIDWVGSISTALAMVSPGLFGLLLSYTLLPDKCPIEIKVILASAVGFCAALGKYRLMRFYSIESSKWLDKINLRDLCSSTHINLSNLINLIFSGVASGGFSYLAQVSVSETASLARDLKSNFADSVADIVESPHVWVTLVVSNFIANMICFPPMHNFAGQMLRQLVKDSFTSPMVHKEKLQLKAQLAETLKPFMQEFNKLAMIVQNEYSEGMEDELYTGLLTKLKLLFGENSLIINETEINSLPIKVQLYEMVEVLLEMDDQTLKQNILNIGNNSFEDHALFTRFVISKIIGIIMTGFCIVGLSNFVKIASDMANTLEIKDLGIGLAIMIMVSMSLMAFTSVFFYGEWLTSNIKPSYVKISPEIVSKRQQLLNQTFNTIACLIGVTPNTYQSLVIAQQSIYLAMPAALGGSFFLEVAGACQLSNNLQEESILNNIKKFEPDFIRLVELAKKLDNLTNPN